MDRVEELIKLCQQKIDKEIETSWSDLAEKFSFKNGESLRTWFKKYRKANGTLPTRKEVKIKEVDNKLTEIDTQLFTIQKEKIKLRDERVELNRIVRKTARTESLYEVIENAVKNSNLPKFSFVKNNIKPSDNDLLVNITDLHYGIQFDNGFFGKYSPQICIERLNMYFNKILEIKKRHNSQNCFIFLGGDLVSGLIHNTIRVANVENTIEQVKQISEILSDFIYKLSLEFDEVKIHSVAGNHSRLFQDKKESQKDERLDILVPWYIKARLHDVRNIKILDNNIDSTIALIDIRGKIFYGVHGDFDSPNKVADKLTLVTGYKPYAIVMGHLHHNCFDTNQGIKVIMSGSLMGIDEYCIEKRIYGYPSQMICVCNDKGVDCLYDVEF